MIDVVCKVASCLLLFVMCFCLLDFACGKGKLVRPLLERFKGRDADAIRELQLLKDTVAQQTRLLSDIAR